MSAKNKIIQHKHGNIALSALTNNLEAIGEIAIKTTKDEEAIITKIPKPQQMLKASLKAVAGIFGQR